MNNSIEQVRDTIVQNNEELRGNAEIGLLREREDLKELFNKIQSLKEEMRKEINEAISEVESRYQEQIKSLEDDYAFLLLMLQ